MIEALKDRRVIFIVRVGIATHVVEMVETIWRAGGSFVEITLNTPGALKSIKHLSSRVPEGCYLGAGTVVKAGDVEAAHAAGASYVVTPVSSQSMILKIKELGLMGVAGASTPTEVYNAHAWGADFVKMFPVPSADVVKAIRAPLGSIPLVAVGGISRENAIKYLKVGCSAVGVGGSFLQIDTDGSFDPAELEASVRAMVRVCSLTSS